MQENQIEPFCFTDEQKKVLDLSFGQHLVLAAPGTGKTELLAHRIVQAFENGVPPHKMLCLTFTVRAAQNMMDRVHQYLPGVDMEVGNIHSFCSRLLHEKKLIPQATSIIDQQTKHEWISDICGDLTPQEVIRLKECSSGHGFVDDSNLSLPVSQIASVCSLLNRCHSGVPDSLIKPSMRKIKVYRDCYEIAVKLSNEYFRLKQERMVLDYEDLLTDAYLFLAANKQIENTFDWIQIDEVQDLSPLQWAIIDLLTSDRAHAVYFGDMEQAIFSFMGASVSQLNNVAMKCEIHNLQKNFRSPSYLLDVFIRYALNQRSRNQTESMRYAKSFLTH